MLYLAPFTLLRIHIYENGAKSTRFCLVFTLPSTTNANGLRILLNAVCNWFSLELPYSLGVEHFWMDINAGRHEKSPSKSKSKLNNLLKIKSKTYKNCLQKSSHL